MNRMLPRYTDDRLSPIVDKQRALRPDAHHQLIADLCAVVLTQGQADDVALDHASDAVMAYLQRQTAGVR